MKKIIESIPQLIVDKFIISLFVLNVSWLANAAVSRVTIEESGNSALRFGQIMEQTNDISARRFPKMSESNHCALVKVRCPISGLNFPLSEYEEDKGNGEYWVYYKNGTSEITISHSSKLKETLDLSLTNVEYLKGKITYLLSIIPSEDMYISQFDEKFEDEEEEDIKNISLFGKEFEDCVLSFRSIYNEISSYKVDIDFPCHINLNKEIFQKIRKASEAGWPDATMILICILHGRNYCLFEDFNRYNNVSEAIIKSYANSSPMVSDFIRDNKASFSKFENLYKAQVARLESLLAEDMPPHICINKIYTPIRCSPKEYRELQDQAKQYEQLTNVLYGTSNIRVMNDLREEVEYGLVLEYDYERIVKGSYVVDRANELSARFQISPICAKFIDRMRLHRWNALVKIIQNLKK